MYQFSKIIIILLINKLGLRPIVILSVLLLIFFNTSFSQIEEEIETDISSASFKGNVIQLSTTATASLTVLRGVSISLTGSNSLAFGDIYAQPNSQTRTITNQLGQQFLVQGNPGTNVIINYSSSSTLNNALWVLQNGGTQGTISYTANPLPVQTLANSTYTNPVTVNNGSSVVLTNSGGIGKLYIWVGGQITINANQPVGDYIGYFNINVSY
jgi:hypothetical protein